MASEADKVIISLGGSVIVPGEVNTKFLSAFRVLVKDYAKTHKLIIVCGGGKVCRLYQQAARALGIADTETLDELGISVTYVNAMLVKSLLQEIAHPDVIADPTRKIAWKKQVLVASGWKPGCSTDYDAVLHAKAHGIRTIINVSNTDYVYDKDPKYHKDAKPFHSISWPDFRKLFVEHWSPGLHVPFDPVASKEAEKLGIRVFLVGADLKNLKALLAGKKFKGTVIS